MASNFVPTHSYLHSKKIVSYGGFYCHLVRQVQQCFITVGWTFEGVSSSRLFNLIRSIAASNLYTRNYAGTAYVFAIRPDDTFIQ